MMNPRDPWQPIRPPDRASAMTARRVDPTLDWELFWALDINRDCLLVFHHQPANSPQNKLPLLSGLDIEVQHQEQEPSMLILRLRDSEQREIFHRLCLDIVAAVKLARTESGAIERFVARTWRWHRLLKGGKDGRLTAEEQKGLLGELTVLRETLFPAIGIQNSLRAWTGPLSSPKDFEIARLCIEAKARHGASKPFITISNEYQLDTEGLDALLLHVSEITAASDNDAATSTVTEFAKDIEETVRSEDPALLELLDQRLLATGFDWADDYSDFRWLIGPRHVYEITDTFPRITPSSYISGIKGVRYSISLTECEEFKRDLSFLDQAVHGEIHVNRR